MLGCAADPALTWRVRLPEEHSPTLPPFPLWHAVPNTQISLLQLCPSCSLSPPPQAVASVLPGEVKRWCVQTAPGNPLPADSQLDETVPPPIQKLQR